MGHLRRAALVLGIVLLGGLASMLTRSALGYGCDELCYESHFLCPYGYCASPGTHGISYYHWFTSTDEKNTCNVQQQGGCDQVTDIMGCKYRLYTSGTGCTGPYTWAWEVKEFQICDT